MAPWVQCNLRSEREGPWYQKQTLQPDYRSRNEVNEDGHTGKLACGLTPRLECGVCQRQAARARRQCSTLSTVGPWRPAVVARLAQTLCLRSC